MEKVETILNYKSTFVLTEGKKYNCDAKASISQREQYGGTVHLFIGTGHSLWEIIIMPFTFTIGLYKIYEDWTTFSLLGRFPFLWFSRSFVLHSFGAMTTFVTIKLLIVSAFIMNPKIPVHKPYLENIVKLHFWGPSEDEGPQQRACVKKVYGEKELCVEW
jgi:hypothetical protein